MVEIVNIQLNEMESWSDEQVNNLLNQKIQGKLNRTGIRENSNFQLIPVLWGSIEELNRVNTFYKTNGISFRNTSIPVCYVVH